MEQGKVFLEQFLEQIHCDVEKERRKFNLYGVWRSLLREELADQCRILGIDRGVLKIGTGHSVYLQELRLSEGEWLPRLKKAFKEYDITAEPIRKVQYRILS